VPYEQRYHDAKFNLEIFILRNVIVLVDFVRLKFPSLDGASLHSFRSGLL